MITSASVEETLAFARELSQTLRRTDVLALMGDLGAGKTHFVKGVVAGLGSDEAVTSPTFTLLHEYIYGRLPVYHFDFYRMEDEDEVLRIGFDDYLDSDGVCVIEWADKFPWLLPPHTRWWRFSQREDGLRVIEETTAPIT